MPRFPTVRRLAFVALSLGVAMLAVSVSMAQADKPLVVGSKRFTESYVLGEIVRRTLADHGVPVAYKAGLGNTGILVAALEAGEIDLYPEYTGTIAREILKRDDRPSLAALNAGLAPRGLKAAIPLGFSNTYALAMRADEADQRGIARVSDLAKANGLKWGLSNEFLARTDGWIALKAAYGLPFPTPSGLDHGLAYDALANRHVDVIDIYSTDARIGRDGVRVLEDDRHFFPAYDAVLLMRRDVDPGPLAKLEGAIDTKTMIALNAEAELDHRAFADVAAGFVDARGGHASAPPRSAFARFTSALFASDFGRLLVEHLALVLISVGAAIAVALPLGVVAARRPRAGRAILVVVGLLQTIPSLALLALVVQVLLDVVARVVDPARRTRR
jgi:osmoprotectant transport system permease protein